MFSSPSRTRTYDNSVNSRALYRLSYRGIFIFFSPISSVCITINALPLSYRGLFYFYIQKSQRTCALRLFLALSFSKYLQNYTLCLHLPEPTRSSLRPISIRQLHTLLHFHLEPIYLVVFKGSYLNFRSLGYLILRGASRLDAFSVYPGPTWLPGYALGSTTGTPAVSPPRSSRTKGSSSQISYARAG